MAVRGGALECVLMREVVGLEQRILRGTMRSRRRASRGGASRRGASLALKHAGVVSEDDDAVLLFHLFYN